MATDLRIPVMFIDPAAIAAILRADDAVLAEDGIVAPPAGLVVRFSMAAVIHVLRCNCCAGRPAAVQALATMFLARARGEGLFFRRVIAIVHDRTLVRRLLEDDVVTRARFCIIAAPTVTGF